MKYSPVKMRSTEPKRSYHQRLRAESSAQTRQRILEAAREALGAQPRRGFNISEIAEQARVVRSTIYTVFGSREGLLRAVAQDMAERGGWQRMREAFRHPDALVAITRNIEEGTSMAASEHAVALGISSLATVDPDAAAVAAEMDEARLRGLHSLAGRLDEQGYLRPGIDHEQAVDILFVLTSWNTFDQLHTGRGLDQPAIAQRLTTMFRRTLCRPESLAAADEAGAAR
jgi:AcrR family transcriptional regulator